MSHHGSCQSFRREKLLGETNFRITLLSQKSILHTVKARFSKPDVAGASGPQCRKGRRTTTTMASRSSRPDKNEEMYDRRGLESEEARAKYSSLEEHVDAKRFRMPWLLAWLSVTIFCSASDSQSFSEDLLPLRCALSMYQHTNHEHSFTLAHTPHTHTHRTHATPQVHILVPTFLTWFALTVVFCYRGDEVMEVVETATRMMLDVFHVSG